MLRGWFLALPLGLAAAGWAAPAMRVVASGVHSSVTQPGAHVARTQEAWRKIWDEHMAKVEPKTAPPAVDFKKEMVLAVFMGQRPTSGYSVAITDLAPGEKGSVVSVRRSSPPPGAITAQIVTSPFVFVAVPKSDGPVKFVYADVGGRR